jgi:hypothetical protein
MAAKTARLELLAGRVNTLCRTWEGAGKYFEQVVSRRNFHGTLCPRLNRSFRRGHCLQRRVSGRDCLGSG